MKRAAVPSTNATENSLRGEAKVFIRVEEKEKNNDFVKSKSLKNEKRGLLPNASSGDRWYFVESTKQEMNQCLKKTVATQDFS